MGLSDEEIKAYGFYDVITPDHNAKSEKLSDIFWDNDNKVFTYNVEDKDLSNITIEELKELIKNIKVKEIDGFGAFTVSPGLLIK